eukprot:CAMPEP_0179465270 /NCGR_PEP_ID=MMETSP0799-20121207/46876_1 /TAXON_ID=46947 /ORGANISM="Geminigera cryophila, Strain CCMP2564" /LENGTH=338 /DNA_ID=CAMNT_0021269465 /DNA_START=71 /DNA_END=1084 /DNA_ORIENTATION=-
MAEESLDAEQEALESYFQGEDAEIVVDKSRWKECQEAVVQLQIELGSVPSPCTVMKDDGTTCSITYLAPIQIRAVVNTEYPDKAPDFTIECPWLSLGQLTALCVKLDEIAEENLGGAILFQWAVYLHTEPAIEMSDPICLPGPMPNSSTQTPFDVRARAACSSAAQIWQEIERQDSAKRRRAFLATHHTCGVCFDDVAGSRALQLSACQHIFCTNCITGLCEVQISEGAVQFVRCPEIGCGENLLPHDIQPLVDRDMYSRYETFTLKRALESMDDLSWCPRCEGAVIKEQEDALARCSTCNYNFCTLCRAPWHPGTCARTDNDTLKRLRESLAVLQMR